MTTCCFSNQPCRVCKQCQTCLTHIVRRLAKGWIVRNRLFFSNKGCPQNLRWEVKDSLNVHSESLSERYLGMPMDVGYSINGTFSYLRDKVWERIRGWMVLEGGTCAQNFRTLRCGSDLENTHSHPMSFWLLGLGNESEETIFRTTNIQHDP